MIYRLLQRYTRWKLLKDLTVSHEETTALRQFLLSSVGRKAINCLTSASIQRNRDAVSKGTPYEAGIAQGYFEACLNLIQLSGAAPQSGINGDEQEQSLLDQLSP